MSAGVRASARAETQRRRLRQATHATRSERERRREDHTTVVLAALASKLAPVSLSGGWLQAHTGLADDQTASALRDLEDEGRIAPGSLASGRADFLTPAVLDLLGLADFALPWEVLPDVPPPSGGVAHYDDEHEVAA